MGLRSKKEKKDELEAVTTRWSKRRGILGILTGRPWGGDTKKRQEEAMFDRRLDEEYAGPKLPSSQMGANLGCTLILSA